MHKCRFVRENTPDQTAADSMLGNERVMVTLSEINRFGQSAIVTL